MTLHLKGEGKGDPIPEPAFKTEDPETLRCFPGDTRPKDFMTIPKFAAQEGKKLNDTKLIPVDAAGKSKESDRLRKVLAEKTLGGFPDVKAEKKWTEGFEDLTLYDFHPEPGLKSLLRVRYDANAARPANAPTVLVLSLDGWASKTRLDLENAVLAAGLRPITFDLRATGSLRFNGDKVGRAPDHNSAEWGLWLGRPLLGQWVFDIRQFINSQSPTKDKDGKPIPARHHHHRRRHRRSGRAVRRGD